MPEWALKVGRKVRFFYDLANAARIYHIYPEVILLHQTYNGLWESIAQKSRRK
jgi:hypothetical protein